MKIEITDGGLNLWWIVSAADASRRIGAMRYLGDQKWEYKIAIGGTETKDTQFAASDPDAAKLHIHEIYASFKEAIKTESQAEGKKNEISDENLEEFISRQLNLTSTLASVMGLQPMYLILLARHLAACVSTSIDGLEDAKTAVRTLMDLSIESIRVSKEHKHAFGDLVETMLKDLGLVESDEADSVKTPKAS